MFIAKKTKSDLSASALRFADGRRDAASRYKHLRLHCDQLCKDNDDELKLFFEQHRLDVFQLFLELLVQAEPPSAGGLAPARVNLADLEGALWLLEAVLHKLPEAISRRWQFAAIESVLKRLLHPDSLLGLRRIGLRLFLVWYQCLRVNDPSGADSHLDAWFANLVPCTSDARLQEICETPGSRVWSFNIGSTEEPRVYCRKSQPLPISVPAKRSGNEMLITQSFMEKMLEFVCNDCSKVLWNKPDREAKQLACLRFLVCKVYDHYAWLCCPGVGAFDVEKVVASCSLDPFCEFDTCTSLSSATVGGNVDQPTVDGLRRICAHVVIRWLALYTLSYADDRQLSSSTAADSSMNVSELNDSKQNNSLGERSSSATSRTPVNHSMVRRVLLSDKELCRKTYALLREAFFLPPNCVGTVARVFRVLREWLLFDSAVPTDGEDSGGGGGGQMERSRQVKIAIAILVSFFDGGHLKRISSEVDQPEQTAPLVTQICIRILTLFKQLACNTMSSSRMNQDAWHFLLKALLHVVHRSTPELPPPTASGDQSLAAVAPQIFQTLLVTWVFAGLNVALSCQLWDELLTTLKRRTSWPPLLLEWAKVMESISRALGLQLYGVDLMDPPLERGRLKRKKLRRRDRPPSTTLSPDDPQHRSVAEQSMQISLLLQSSSSVAGKRLAADGGCAVDVESDGDLSHGLDEAAKESLDTVKTDVVQQQPLVSDDSDTCDSASGRLSTSTDGPASTVPAGVKSMLLAEDLAESSIMSTTDADTMSDEFVCCQDSETSSDQCMDIPKSMLVAESAPPEPLGIVWRRVLGCLGDVNQIRDPQIHVHAMEVVRLVLNLLIKIRNNQTASPRLVPPADLLLPWLTDALRLSRRSFATSRAIAARLYCAAMGQRHDVPLSDALLADFFVFASSLVLEDDEALVNGFLVSWSTSMFGQFWPGSLLVLPELLTAASRIIRASSSSIVFGQQRDGGGGGRATGCLDRTNVVHLVSSITLLAAYRPPFATYQEPSKCLDTQTVQTQLFRCLLDSLDCTDGDSAIALCGLSLLLHSLLRNCRLNGIVDGCFETMLKHLLQAGCSLELRIVVCQLFNSLLVFCADLTESHFRLLRHLFSAYTEAGQRLLSEDDDVDGQPAAAAATLIVLLERICSDLVEWLLLVPHLVADSLGDQQPAPLLSLLRILDAILHKSWSQSAKAISFSLYSTLTCCFDQKAVPLPCPPPHLQQQQLFTVGLPCIGTLLGKTSHNTITSRTSVGLHLWRMSRLDQRPQCISSAQQWLCHIASGWRPPSTDRPQQQAGDEQVAPCPLNTLLDQLFTSCDDCTACFQPIAASDDDDDLCSMMPACTAVCCWQEDQRPQTCLDQFACNVQFDLAFANSVLALSCLDRLQRLVLVDQTEQSDRHLRHIDGLPCRELHKIAVLYVAAGQEDKQSILDNGQGSARFEQFVDGLGWQVALRSHAGYAGGLSADADATYYCTPLVEVVFHVSTRMDCTAANRLRHIGNDEVHIVWSEHWRDYRRSTIPTEYCDILIAIYPLHDDLYRVQIDCDDADAVDLGPLFNDAVVHWSVLACLVRCTAVNANRLKRRAIDGYQSAHRLRLNGISEMMRCSAKITSASQLLARLYWPVVHYASPST